MVLSKVSFSIIYSVLGIFPSSFCNPQLLSSKTFSADILLVIFLFVLPSSFAIAYFHPAIVLSLFLCRVVTWQFSPAFPRYYDVSHAVTPPLWAALLWFCFYDRRLLAPLGHAPFFSSMLRRIMCRNSALSGGAVLPVSLRPAWPRPFCHDAIASVYHHPLITVGLSCPA